MIDPPPLPPPPRLCACGSKVKIPPSDTRCYVCGPTLGPSVRACHACLVRGPCTCPARTGADGARCGRPVEHTSEGRPKPACPACLGRRTADGGEDPRDAATTEYDQWEAERVRYRRGR